MTSYDAWKTACPPEGKTLRVTMTLTVDVPHDALEDAYGSAKDVAAKIDRTLARVLPDADVTISDVDGEVLR